MKPLILNLRDQRNIQTLGVLGVTPADSRAWTPSCTWHTPWVLPPRVWLMHRHRLVQTLPHSSALIHSLTSAWEEGKPGKTQTGFASNRNIPKTGRSGTPIPAALTDTALPTPALPQGAHGSFLPSQEGPVLGSIPWICPSGRVIPKFNPPGTTLACSRASSALPPSHSHRLIG